MNGIADFFTSLIFLQLNFARFRRQLRGFKKTTPNTQVIGFSEDDSHLEVMTKAAKGLGISCDISLLSLICSNGLVPDSQIDDSPWTLGKYVQHHGGNRNRGKKVWGLYIPFDADEDEFESSTGDSESI